MDSSIESLFGQLKESLQKPLTVESKQSKSWTGEDELAIEDENETKRKETFEDIEKSLKKLPKLNNEFDNLAKDAKRSKSVTSKDTVKPEASSAKGSSNADWFTLPKPNGEMLAKAQRDLVLIKHRSALDPKRHYKKERWQVPERFAIGTLVEDSTEFFSSRLTNRERKSTMLETLMNDKDTTGYFKRKYSEIQSKKTSGKKAHFKNMKSLRRR